MLENLNNLLTRAEELAEDLGEYFDPYDRLRQVLADANVPDHYDTVIVDPPATAGPHLYNGVAATHSLVIPVEPTGKGMASISGLEGIAGSLEDQLDIDVGVLAVVPNGIGSTTDQERYLDEIRDLGFDAPVALAERSSLFEGCWDAQLPPMQYTRKVRSAYDYEEDTLAKLDGLAYHLEEVSGI
jgi:chromosome partitioning protein